MYHLQGTGYHQSIGLPAHCHGDFFHATLDSVSASRSAPHVGELQTRGGCADGVREAPRCMVHLAGTTVPLVFRLYSAGLLWWRSFPKYGVNDGAGDHRVGFDAGRHDAVQLVVPQHGPLGADALVPSLQHGHHGSDLVPAKCARWFVRAPSEHILQARFGASNVECQRLFLGSTCLLPAACVSAALMHCVI